MIFEELKADTERRGLVASFNIDGDPVIVSRPASMKRLLANLVGNAQRYGEKLEFSSKIPAIL